MPISKFRRIEEMPAIEPAPQEEAARRMRALWDRAHRFCVVELHKGVSRFASIAEANEAREASTAERLRRRAKLPLQR